MQDQTVSSSEHDNLHFSAMNSSLTSSSMDVRSSSSSHTNSNSCKNDEVVESATTQSHETVAASAQTRQIEVIEIDDSESDNDVEVVAKRIPQKRKHFFPDNETEVKRQSADMYESKTSCSTAPDSTQHSIDYPFSDRSSAYIQHIAEACNLIMTDARWRTCTKTSCKCHTADPGADCTNKTLLSWENGDDLSAVKAFMSLYDEDYTIPCSESASDTTNADERAMHLYSRMFHRKGPWFDLADLYCRYYAPKMKTKQSAEFEQSNDITETPASEKEPESTESSDPKKSNSTEKQKRNNFFTPKSGRSSISSCIPKRADNANNKKCLQHHGKALELLFHDVLRLMSMGLIRTFVSEYECGLVAGNVSTGSRRGTFLLAEERREVLRRLGGDKSPKAGDSDADSNEILTQMQKQQSMFSSYSSSTKVQVSLKDQGLLPVQKHVDYVLTRKLAFKIASMASGAGPLSKPRKADVNDAQQMIQNAWTNICNARNHNSFSLPKQVVTTLRMREPPLTALRRVLRLFLCAGGGPGNMRGDGSNGWIHVPSVNTNPKVPDQWNNVVYPGLTSRLGVASVELRQCYQKLAADTQSIQRARIFQHHFSFRLWEIGVELRSFIDRAMEVYETNRSNRRRRLASVENGESFTTDTVLKVHDQFEVLSTEGRNTFVNRILATCPDMRNSICAQTTIQRIESDIASLHQNHEDECDGLTNDTERMIVAVAIICHRILQDRMSVPATDLDALVSRPWLRHFSIDSILVYILWDSIPLLERNGLYSLAISFLTTTLLGSTHNDTDLHIDKVIELVNSHYNVSPSIQLLLPRRNRGKAFDRLVKDLNHVERARKKKEIEQSSTKNSRKTKSDDCATIKDQTPIQRLCKSIIYNTSMTDSIPFCSIRNLARRLKVPLHDTLKESTNRESSLLGIRLDNDDAGNETRPDRYSDWTPTTDFAVANAVSNGDKSTLGKRCSFVGWENENNGQDIVQSAQGLTVEELALEEYNQGRLPEDESLDNGLKGGYVGWHCEGSHIRAIFRILCLNDLLCHDFAAEENIFITPYQTSPYDLHVGMQMMHIFNTEDESSLVPAKSFYERRRVVIDAFLDRLSGLDPQSICNGLYDAVQKRWQHKDNMAEILKDESLQRDAKQLRSLSCIAAGLGGEVLARIFRPMCFDYRHFCGGLPDLLLVRARYSNDDTSLVDLGDWIGEAFSDEHIEKGKIKQGENMLRDDEFLGCTKNGDALGSSQKNISKTSPIEPITILPPTLSLEHNGKEVKVDTVLVEVKSANDRLDARQEDWLNILDESGRVCKFENKKEGKKRSNNDGVIL